MERSDRHSPRVDEEIKHDTAPLTHGAGIESHSRDDLRQETPSREEGAPDPSARNDVPAPVSTLSPDEANERADLARVLAPVQFPAARELLIEAALENHADDGTLGRLRRLPPSQQFATVQDVWVATGGVAEASNHS
jgi:hypothetical protein